MPLMKGIDHQIVPCFAFGNTLKNRMAKKIKKTLKKIDRASDIPASQGQLEAVRSELKSDITSVLLRLDALTKLTDSRFERASLETDARFKQASFEMSEMRSRFEQASLEMDTRFEQASLKMDSRFEKMMAAIYNVTAIVEEQNARNKLVIDGYKIVIDVQEDLRERTSRVEKKIFGIDKA